MAVLGRPVPIETGEHIVRARRTAAATRVAMGVAGIVLVAGWPSLVEQPAFAIIGFATIVVSASVQLAAPGLSLLRIEESLAGIAGVLIIGFGPERADIVSTVWLVAIASGVLARGGRVGGVGRVVVLIALALPFIRLGEVEPSYVALCVATIGLLLTSGRLTRELNLLLRQARLQADSAEALLLAGDIAARMVDRTREHPSRVPAAPPALSGEELAGARSALAGLVQGEGLELVVQPILDVRTGLIHSYEALARFGERREGATPLHWFALAEQLGGRPALERACLREALSLHPERPPRTALAVNVSAPVLLEAHTLALLEDLSPHDSAGLEGLIVEITEETLVGSEQQLRAAVEPLLARGMELAVDDVGAGYSGLRQLTTVRPRYLKLDRALISRIDCDAERSALVGALVGYAAQVGSLLVAEGVETGDELRVLKRLGVPLVQGFFIGRPAPPWPGFDAHAGEPEAARGAPASVEAGAGQRLTV